MSNYSLPKNVFLHLLMMAMLYATVISLMVLLNNYVNVVYPDTLDYYANYFEPIRLSSSILLVAFPVFVIMNWIIEKEAKKMSQIKESAVRKWLIYLTLFVSAVTIIIYLIRLVFNFYSGELTLPFFLKVIVVLVLAGVVFVYYFMDLYGRIKKPRLWLYSVTLLIITSLVAGFFIVGSPAYQRKVRFDMERVNNLSQIQWEIVSYWQYKGKLPNGLDDLHNEISGYLAPVDPKNHANYAYKVIDDLSFELCAEFETESRLKNEDGMPHPVYGFGKGGLAGDSNWAHGMSNVCFVRKIDPDFYKLKTP